VVEGDVPLPEGIAWDTAANAGYLGSTLQRKVMRLEPGGRAAEFVPPAWDGLLSPLGMHVDRARGLLWVASAAFEFSEGYDDSLAGRSALHAFDLRTGATIASWVSPADSAQHNFNDVAVAPDGRTFVTDASTGAVYSTRGPGSLLEETWSAGSFPGANGITLDASGEHLFVAEYIRGVAVIHLPTATRWRLTHAEHVALAGIDGLYFHEQSLIGVQNYGGLNRVARFTLDGSYREITGTAVLEAWHSDFQEPTTAALVGDRALVLANSQLDMVGPDGAAPPPSALRPVVVLRVKLGTRP
jgi:sugar lactone lactonase YvrE